MFAAWVSGLGLQSMKKPHAGIFGEAIPRIMPDACFVETQNSPAILPGDARAGGTLPAVVRTLRARKKRSI